MKIKHVFTRSARVQDYMIRIGSAVVETLADGSEVMFVTLDAIPVDGRLEIRDPPKAQEGT